MGIGNLTIQFVSASPEDILSAASRAGIWISNVQYLDMLHVNITIPTTQLVRFKEIAERFGGEITILKDYSYSKIFREFFCRPVLLIGLCIWMILVLYLPTRILFIEVEGNAAVPTHLILDTAERCGIYFGASRHSVRSEIMKNVLLDEISELQWAGVNTYGCVAVISVKERIEQPIALKQTGVCSIVAAHDGLIHKIIATKGTVRCSVGQAVRKGQVLISGYTDCGLSVKAEQASGEVYARTNRYIDAIFPLKYVELQDKIEEKTVYQIQIGKKIINLNKDSGIPDTRCVKMYYSKQITLPGGFSLPLALVMQRNVYYDTDVVQMNISEEPKIIRDLLDCEIRNNMLAGKILQSDYSTEKTSDSINVYGSYKCFEMIGKIRQEEFLQ